MPGKAHEVSLPWSISNISGYPGRTITVEKCYQAVGITLTAYDPAVGKGSICLLPTPDEARATAYALLAAADLVAPRDPKAEGSPATHVDCRPFIAFDPAMRSGEATINHTRMPVDSIVENIWAAQSVDSVMDTYAVTRADVITACWFAGTHGSRKWRKRWGAWAEHVHGELWHSRYDVPNPPAHSDGTATWTNRGGD